MFEINASFVTSTIAYIGIIFNDMKLLIILIVGLIMGFFIVEKIIEIIMIKKGE